MTPRSERSYDGTRRPGIMVITESQLVAGFMYTVGVGDLFPPILVKGKYKVLKELDDGTFLVEEPMPR